MSRIRHPKDSLCLICYILWEADRNSSRVEIEFTSILPGSSATQACPYRPILEEAILKLCQDPLNREPNEQVICGFNRSILTLRCCTTRPHVPHERLEIFNPEDATILPDLVSIRTLGPDNTDNRTWSFVRQSYEECISAHTLCHQVRDDWRPLRLVKVCEAGLQLKERPILMNGTIDYIALSYCWGNGQSLRLTRSNIQNFRSLIPWNVLPAVFKDCASVASTLGIDHLWIDTLCILQDDATDWSHQSSDMGLIYEMASLVVSATTSANTNVPFLGLDAPNTRGRTQMVNMAQSPGAEGGQGLRARRLVLGSDYSEALFDPSQSDRFWFANGGPLDQRAWAFQERHLARRSLRYSQDETVWRCRTTRHFESLLNYEYMVFPSQAQSVDIEELLFWYDLVRAYTRRHLTFAADRLPAFSGVASHFQQKLKSQYLAGLWELSLVKDLSWWPIFPRKLRQIDLQKGLAGVVQIDGPSWSWSSNADRIDWPFLISMAKIVDCVTVLSIFCERATPNRWGPVKPGASITVKGRLREVSIHAALKSDTLEVMHMISPTGCNQYSLTFSPDSLMFREEAGHEDRDTNETAYSWQKLTVSSIFCDQMEQLFLGAAKAFVMPLIHDHGTSELWSLVLARVPEHDGSGHVCYRRLGLLKQTEDVASDLRDYADANEVVVAIV